MNSWNSCSKTAEQVSGTGVAENFLKSIKKTKSFYQNRTAKRKFILKWASEYRRCAEGFTAYKGSYDVKIKFNESKKVIAKDEKGKVNNVDFEESLN